MSDPDPYVVDYSFSGFQANSPLMPLPAGPVDNEFANIATAVSEVIAALKSVRRPDGALNNNIVTFDSLSLGLQLTFDPTNGELVAAAVLGAQASAAAALGYQNGAAGYAASAHTDALAAAASAAGVNLTLYLAKANNLAGLGSLSTSRSNLGLGSSAVLDAGVLASNVVQLDGSAKLPAIDGSQLINVDVLPVGSVVYVPARTPPAGLLKLNGALLSRTTYARLWAFAQASSNTATEADWAGTFSGTFSTGDLSTTFRIPDGRGEFFRGWDDGRGIDASRSIGQVQTDSLKSHTHPYETASSSVTNALVTTGNSSFFRTGSATGTTSATGGGETRPRNLPLLACIKY